MGAVNAESVELSQRVLSNYHCLAIFDTNRLFNTLITELQKSKELQKNPDLPQFIELYKEINQKIEMIHTNCFMRAAHIIEQSMWEGGAADGKG